MENLGSTEFLIVCLVATVISFVILYYVIKAAIVAGTMHIYKELKISNQFNIRERRKEGIPVEEINQDIENGNK